MWRRELYEAVRAGRGGENRGSHKILSLELVLNFFCLRSALTLLKGAAANGDRCRAHLEPFPCEMSQGSFIDGCSTDPATPPHRRVHVARVKLTV